MERHLPGILLFLVVCSASVTIAVSVRDLIRPVDDSAVPVPALDAENRRPKSIGIQPSVTYAQYDAKTEMLTVRVQVPDEKSSSPISGGYVVVRIFSEDAGGVFSDRRVVPMTSGVVLNEQLELRFRQPLNLKGRSSVPPNFVVSARIDIELQAVDRYLDSDFGPTTQLIFVHPKMAKIQDDLRGSDSLQ